MRTTLTIEPTVEKQIRERMRRRQVRLKSVINDLLREGLRASENEPVRRRPAFKVEPHAFGFRAGIDLDRIGQFADELEDEQRLAGLAAKRRS
jgi:hypothetical protein